MRPRATESWSNWPARHPLRWEKAAFAAATAFVRAPASFDAVRFLLGIAEAGALPGFALYVTLWFPSAYRARAIAGYIIAGQIAAIVGSPLAAILVSSTDNLLGLHGWQWMFILEGLPTVLLGIAFFTFLTERPADARSLGCRTAHLAAADARCGARSRGRRAAFPARRRGF